MIALLAAGVVSVPVVGAITSSTALATSAPQKAATGQLRAAHIDTGNGIRTLPTLSAGVIDTASSGNSRRAAQAQAPAANSGGGSVGASNGTVGCAHRGTSNALGNVRVNQDCTFRLQGEEVIKFNPANPSNLLAGMNDERQGYNLSAFAYSFDSGKTWGDGPPPFYQKINAPDVETPVAGDPNSHTITGQPGNGFTYDGGSDPMLAFDLAGRAFFGDVIFDRFAGAGAAVVVTQSPAGAGGSFFQTPATFSRHYIIAEDNDLSVFHDKPFLAVDITPSSPNRDNVYVTWTVFRFDASGVNYLQSPIYGSMSTDHGLTWSTPEQISGTSNLCDFGNQFDPTLDRHSCNFDQGSDPVALPNGDLEVVFNNGNTLSGNPNAQTLAVLCHPAGNSPAGSAALHCDPPVKVGDDVIQGEPTCDLGRGPEQCIPGSFVRTSDFPRIAVNPGNGNVYATWPDYRSSEYDIQLSRSTDGGHTWTAATAPVNSSRGIDHYQAAIDVVCSGKLAKNNPACVQNGGDQNSTANADSGNNSNNSNGSGGQLCGSGNSSASTSKSTKVDDLVAISYYRTCQVPNENCTGGCPVFGPPQAGVQAENSDYTLVSGRGLQTAYSGSPVSPVFPPPDGTRQTGFMGDYSGITLVGNIAHPIWADPRNGVPLALRDPDQPVVRDEDVFTVARRVGSSE
jgi:hypothetical protein